MPRALSILVFGALAWSAKAAEPKPFAILNGSVSHVEDGPSLPGDFEFRPGESVYVSFQISGFQLTGSKVKIGYQVNALDFRGAKLVETMSGAVDTEVAPEDKEWMPKVRKTVELPPLAATGVYKIEISAREEGSGRAAVKELSFPVRGRPVAESTVLILRNFAFSRGEEDRVPLGIAAYRPGDAVWARFDITGYRLGDGNKFDVDYQVSVLGPSGKVLYTQPEPTAE